MKHLADILRDMGLVQGEPVKREPRRVVVASAGLAACVPELREVVKGIGEAASSKVEENR